MVVETRIAAGTVVDPVAGAVPSPRISAESVRVTGGQWGAWFGGGLAQAGANPAVASNATNINGGFTIYTGEEEPSFNNGASIRGLNL